MNDFLERSLWYENFNDIMNPKETRKKLQDLPSIKPQMPGEIEDGLLSLERCNVQEKIKSEPKYKCPNCDHELKPNAYGYVCNGCHSAHPAEKIEGVKENPNKPIISFINLEVFKTQVIVVICDSKNECFKEFVHIINESVDYAGNSMEAKGFEQDGFVEDADIAYTITNNECMMPCIGLNREQVKQILNKNMVSSIDGFNPFLELNNKEIFLLTTLSHEALHAAKHVMHSICCPDEETLAYVQEYIAKELINIVQEVFK